MREVLNKREKIAMMLLKDQLAWNRIVRQAIRLKIGSHDVDTWTNLLVSLV